jgi:hypothetical protein
MNPPSLAFWLLDRLGLSETVTGDLVEEYARRRSSMWLWRQVGVAIVGSVWRDVAGHKLVAVGGVLIGWATLWCTLGLLTWVAVQFGGPTVHAAYWHWPHYVVLVVVACTVSAFGGWTVGRLHRAHRQAAVFSFMSSVPIVFLIEFPLLYWLARPVVEGVIAPHWASIAILTFVAAPISIALGGLWHAPGTGRGPLDVSP